MNQNKTWEAERHYSRIGAILILLSLTISLLASAFIVYLLTSCLSLSDDPVTFVVMLLFALGLTIRPIWLVILLFKDIISWENHQRVISSTSTIFGGPFNLSQSVMNQAAIILGVVVYATPFVAVLLLIHMNVSSVIVKVLGIAYTIMFFAFLFRKRRWFDSFAELRRRTSSALVEKCKTPKRNKDHDELKAYGLTTISGSVERTAQQAQSVVQNEPNVVNFREKPK